MSATGRRVAVVGAGWAGLAAAVQATRLGQAVTLYDTAPQPGGRARSTEIDGRPLDNGQHILVGAYAQTLALMRAVGVDPEAVLLRMPLQLLDPYGEGLRLPPGPPWWSFTRGVLAHRRWRLRDRLALLSAAGSWLARGFRCPPSATVQSLTAGLPEPVRRELIDPLCVAALNTPSAQAGAQVFLRVLKDALFGGPGSADLLLPRAPLHRLLPGPALAWLQAHGAELRLRRRVRELQRRPGGWAVDGEAFDRVVLACTAAEAARLVAPHAPGWAAIAGDFRYEPIVTVWLAGESRPWPAPIVALHEGPDAPAQFAFDLGRLGVHPGLFALVVSGASTWGQRGLQECGEAARRQALAAFAPGTWVADPAVLQVTAEKRATFLCTPGLRRPTARIAEGLVAAGDYVEGPYPATLEGAVRSGLEAATAA